MLTLGWCLLDGFEIDLTSTSQYLQLFNAQAQIKSSQAQDQMMLTTKKGHAENEIAVSQDVQM